jgi:murein DD-endopeptidase MepM/ murein hydrolase activator NlpD
MPAPFINMFRFRHLPVLCFLIVALAFSANAQTKEKWDVQWEPAKPVNGSPVLFRVKAPRLLKEMKGNFMEQEVVFRRGSACHCWYAIAGVSLETKPGTYTLQVEGKGQQKENYSTTADVEVSAANYPSTTLKVAPQFVEPPKEAQAKIEEDQATKKKIFASTSQEPLWTGRFFSPVPTATSGGFGAARVFNGALNSQHTGLDFHAKKGTPVHATNNGVVILARGLFYEGNCVMIDHGQGLITMYMHLSKFKVKEGDTIKKGQLIGLSGGTGRATGPHLHFAVRWHGEYLDPKTLLALRPPAS